MTFNQWIETQTLNQNSKDWARLAWYAAVANVNALPHRVMFDAGVEQGTKAAIHQIIYICDDLIASGYDDEVGMLKFAKTKIREKFGLEI